MSLEISASLAPLKAKPPDSLNFETKILPKPEENLALEIKTPEIPREKIAAVMDTLLLTAHIFNHRLKYRINEEIGRVVVQVIDAETDKVIKEIPPLQIQHLIARIKETLGLLVDEKV